jgi:hypothetical protein
MALPHEFKRIRLDLARSTEFPAGSAQHGYEFVAPLDAKGHIDTALWQAHRHNCRVRRFWRGEDDQIGRVVHKPAVRNTPAGCSTTIATGSTMTRSDIALERTPLCQASM